MHCPSLVQSRWQFPALQWYSPPSVFLQVTVESQARVQRPSSLWNLVPHPPGCSGFAQ